MLCKSLAQPRSARLRRHGECDEFRRSACSLTPALIFGAAARPHRSDIAFLRPCRAVPFQGWTVNLSAQSAARPLCLPRHIFASLLRHFLSSVCDLKVTSVHKPHCMSLLHSSGTFTEYFKIDFSCCGFLHNPNNFENVRKKKNLALPLGFFVPPCGIRPHCYLALLCYCITAQTRSCFLQSNSV